MTTSWRNPERSGRGALRGFTLIELLTVVAVIGILMAILIPSVGMVRRNAAVSKSRSQFGQYVTAYEAFRAEMGHYPSMGASGAEFDLKDHNPVFIETLSGFDPAGGRPTTAYATKANPRRMRFYTFAESEFAPEGSAYEGELIDGLENPHLHIVIDRDLDGFVQAGDFDDLPPERRPDHPLRGGVFVYSSNAENNPDWNWILSWE